MSFLSHTWKGHQSGFYSPRAKSVGAQEALKELCKIVLALVIYFAIMTAFVAVGVWIWVPYSHQ